MAKSNDSLSHYLRSLYNVEPLTHDEEAKLAQRIQSGDYDALDKLVHHNLRFVVSVLKGTPAWRHGSLPLEDLVGYGNAWLLTAAKRWKPKNNAKFATYAKKFILKGVRRDVDNTSNLIRLPVNVSEEIKRMKYNERVLMQRLGREPTTSEIAEALSTSERRIHHLRGILLREPSSIDQHTNEQTPEESEEQWN